MSPAATTDSTIYYIAEQKADGVPDFTSRRDENGPASIRAPAYDRVKSGE